MKPDTFAEFFYRAILEAGGSKRTAHLCLAEWWRAVEEADGSEEPAGNLGNLGKFREV